ncbi:MAG TPA: argininosuccinate lyase [Candidatus Binatia bacterium]|nr:argininosuccinate lyase [Candidatus Binatia bacterium]
MKMWSGRFSQGPDAEFEQWQRSFPYDRVLLPYEVAASRAHASALAKAGVLSGAELAATLSALDQIGREGVPQADNPAIEDVHHYVESRLVELAGGLALELREVGWKLHTGRSRNEQIATDLRLYVREQIDEVTHLLGEFAGAFIRQAEAAGGTAMPAYTHLQRAEPVLVAHWLLAYVEMFLRDIGRLADCRKRLNMCPLGSGAVAGTILPLDRDGMAAELGFASPAANSMDATSDRDFALEFVQALSLVALHLSRWAEEFILFASTEFGFVRLPEQYSTGSSAMPQKKNADALELVRGKAGRVFADATALFIGVKGLPLAYNKDLQETQQPVFSAAEQVCGMLRVAAGFMAAVGFDYERMQQTASCGFMNAQAAAAELVRQGVPFRRAHELVGRAVRLCAERGCELEQLSKQDYALCGIDAGEQFYAALALKEVLAVHNVPGGTAPARVRQALQTAKERLEDFRQASFEGARLQACRNGELKDPALAAEGSVPQGLKAKPSNSSGRHG